MLKYYNYCQQIFEIMRYILNLHVRYKRKSKTKEVDQEYKLKQGGCKMKLSVNGIMNHEEWEKQELCFLAMMWKA